MESFNPPPKSNMGRDQKLCGKSDIQCVSWHLVCTLWKQSQLCHPGFLGGFSLCHSEFKGTHAESVGEARYGIHGDRYSRVTTAAGWRQGRHFLFSFTSVVTTVITTWLIEWDEFLASCPLCLFFSPTFYFLTLSLPASPRVTLSHHLFFFFSCCGDQRSLFCPSQSPLFHC